MEKQHALLVAEDLGRLAAESNPEVGRQLFKIRLWIIDRVAGKRIPDGQLPNSGKAAKVTTVKEDTGE